MAKRLSLTEIGTKVEWVNDSRHGRGTYTFANGDIYIGEFASDVMDGKGTYRYANGNVYEGGYNQRSDHRPGYL